MFKYGDKLIVSKDFYYNCVITHTKDYLVEETINPNSWQSFKFTKGNSLQVQYITLVQGQGSEYSIKFIEMEHLFKLSLIRKHIKTQSEIREERLNHILS